MTAGLGMGVLMQVLLWVLFGFFNPATGAKLQAPMLPTEMEQTKTLKVFVLSIPHQEASQFYTEVCMNLI